MRTDMTNPGTSPFEQPRPDEAADIAEIRARMRVAQALRAEQDHRALGRGTHTKGVCVRGTFEVLDLSETVTDPELRRRLARGLFARPGRYEATVRFANGNDRVLPDSRPDVRALSFSVEVPGGGAGGTVRRDFTMNNATTFPWNDAHAFALFVRLSTARGFLGRLRAFATLSPADFWRVVRTLARIVRQMRKPKRPYQAMRYWSTVPYQHGPDEAIKYSAIPGPDNPGSLGPAGDNMLRQELLRHVSDDDRMSSFDFGLQLMEPGRMRRRWRLRPASFWVENAAVEWKESQAPFHVVGRLTLVKGSQLSEAECAAQYIDVTSNSAPESRPIGSINRARWLPEVESRDARLGDAAPPLATPLPPYVAVTRPIWIRALTLGAVARGLAWAGLALVAVVAVLGAATSIYVHRGGGMLPEEAPQSVAYPDQGWGVGVEAEGRQTFYYTPQGAGLKGMRYSWFVNLEMPFSQRRLASVLDRYGFLIDSETDRNPHRLPVGFTRHWDAQLNEELLDITCATCHTGQLQVTRNGQTRAVRIDGGQADHAFTDSDFGHFLPTMMASMASTAVNPFKFFRFARRVLGEHASGGRWALHRELRGVIGTFLGVAWAEKWHKLVPTEEGYGRTDALARITNTVFAENLDPVNYKVGNGPVNYPPVWNIWKFDWVQYNASVSQPMARNLGEAMGVGATYALTDRYGRPLPDSQRFRATARIDDLTRIEETLRRLKPPSWPEDLFGTVDAALAERGKGLFNRHCVGCHGPHVAPPGIKQRNAPLKTERDPEWLMATLCVDDIGTDPNTAMNFVNATVDITRTGMTAPELRAVVRRTMDVWAARQRTWLEGEIRRLEAFRDSTARRDSLVRERDGLGDYVAQVLSGIDPKRVAVGAALSYLGTMIRLKAYEDAGKDSVQRVHMDGFGALDMPQVIPAYKPRPLAGIWATPPFLHNGSVPTIYDLLSPARDRPVTFHVGSREFDPVLLGIYDGLGRGAAVPPDPARPSRAAMERFWIFDTAKDGNHHTGHEFDTEYDPVKVERHEPQSRPGLIGPLLTHDERMAIIEHLKVRDDDRDGPVTPNVPHSCR